MRPRRLALTVLSLTSLLGGSSVLSGQNWNGPATYVLPNVDLSAFIRDTTGLVGVNDRGVDLGGIGSDLFRGPGDGPGVYWMITDRGPNADAVPAGKTFPVPTFTPTILQVRTSGGVIEILQAIPITGAADAARGVSGLPNLLNLTESPAPNEPIFACDGSSALPVNPVTGGATNPNGIDAEGLVRLHDGSFWVVEEYGPSLLHIAPNGRVLRRFFPLELLTYFPVNTPTGYASDDSALSFPAIFGLKRKLNRGFEGLTISPDEKTLYIALQSPLNNPNTAAGNDARNTRIVAFDVQREAVVAEYVYRFQFTGPGNNDDEFDVPSLGTTGRARPRDMKISALTMLDQRRMLVLERTDFKAKVFLVDLKGATDILNSRWDVAATSPALEQYVTDADFATTGVAALPKTLVATFDSTGGFPQKIEGMTVLNGDTLAIANDNDFGVGSFTGLGAACALTGDSGIESQIRVVKLPRPIK